MLICLKDATDVDITLVPQRYSRALEPSLQLIMICPLHDFLSHPIAGGNYITLKKTKLASAISCISFSRSSPLAIL